jgi:hypothetical protein
MKTKKGQRPRHSRITRANARRGAAAAASWPQIRAFLDEALTKQVTFIFDDAPDEWDATVDEEELHHRTESRNLGPGDHALNWSVTGAPGAFYQVQIKGCSPKDFDRSFKFDADGRGLGTCPFKVKL